MTLPPSSKKSSVYRRHPILTIQQNLICNSDGVDKNLFCLRRSNHYLQFVIFAKVASVVAGRFLAGFFVISLASITPNYISTVAPRCPYRCNGPSGLILLQLRLVHFWGLSLSRFTPLALSSKGGGCRQSLRNCSFFVTHMGRN